VFFIAGQLFGLVSSYGYSVSRVIATLVGLWLGGVGFYQAAWDQGIFVPRDPRVRLDPSRSAAWLCADPSKPCLEFPAFVRFDAKAYSAEALLPLSNMEQKSTWALSDRPLVLALGSYQLSVGVRWILIVQSASGSALVVLLGVILSGLLKRD
jgi:hypothetical protein